LPWFEREIWLSRETIHSGDQTSLHSRRRRGLLQAARVASFDLAATDFVVMGRFNTSTNVGNNDLTRERRKKGRKSCSEQGVLL
jgi:hypothetical protein